MTYPALSCLCTLLPLFGLNWPLAHTDLMNQLLSPLMSDRWLRLTPHRVMVTNEGSFHTSGSHCVIYHSLTKIIVTVCVRVCVCLCVRIDSLQNWKAMTWSSVMGVLYHRGESSIVGVMKVFWSFITHWWKKSNTVCVTVCLCVCVWQRGQGGPWVEWCSLTQTGQMRCKIPLFFTGCSPECWLWLSGYFWNE